MADWQELVRQRLADLALDAEEKDEVEVELAAHLEESYEVFCKEGLPEREALHRTLEQVADWRDLQRRICIARRSGHPRQKHIHQLSIPRSLPLKPFAGFLVPLPQLAFNPPPVFLKEPDHPFHPPVLPS